jgi:hypothetical protein
VQPTVAARRGKRAAEEGTHQLKSMRQDGVQKELAMVAIDQGINEEEEHEVYRRSPVKKQPGPYYIHVSLVCYGYCLPSPLHNVSTPSNISQLER